MRSPFERRLDGFELPDRAHFAALIERDAAAVGVWENEYTGRKHPRLQILTLAEIFQGKRPNIPLMDLNVGKSAKAEDVNAGRQGSLL